MPRCAAEFLRTDPGEWPALTRRAVDEQGQSYAVAIDRPSCRGRISEQMACARGGASDDGWHFHFARARHRRKALSHVAQHWPAGPRGDARCPRLLPILCFVVYWSWITFYIAVTGTLFFSTISFFGLTLPAVFRLIRRLLVGPIRPAVPAWNRRRLGMSAVDVEMSAARWQLCSKRESAEHPVSRPCDRQGPRGDAGERRPPAACCRRCGGRRGVWREATRKGFALDIVRDREALLGYRLQGIGAGSFTAVMLATMEATAQVARLGAIVVNDLNRGMGGGDRAARTQRPRNAARRGRCRTMTARIARRGAGADPGRHGRPCRRRRRQQAPDRGLHHRGG